MSETHYYPFGLAMNGAWYNDAVTSATKYLYNGKELNDEFGLNLNDYGARWYDASIGRWWSIDPLAEITASRNPYHYVSNNPANATDPTGMAEQRGADGITNEQWVNATRGADGRQNDNIRAASDGNIASDRERAAELSARGQSREITEDDVNHIRGVHAVYQKDTPNIYGFTLSAFAAGKPNILHYDKSRYENDLRRKFSTKFLKGRGKDKLDRDEYPFASTREGGRGAMVAYVPSSENRKQGGQLGALYSMFLQDGDAFIVIAIPDNGSLPDPVTIPTSRRNAPTYMERMAEVTGLTGTALVFYIIISEGSRIYPPRNLVPVP